MLRVVSADLRSLNLHRCSWVHSAIGHLLASRYHMATARSVRRRRLLETLHDKLRRLARGRRSHLDYGRCDCIARLVALVYWRRHQERWLLCLLLYQRLDDLRGRLWLRLQRRILLLDRLLYLFHHRLLRLW